MNENIDSRLVPTSAHRLYLLLKLVSKRGGNKGPAHRAWADFFGCPAESTQCFEHLSAVRKLSEDVVRDIQALKLSEQIRSKMIGDVNHVSAAFSFEVMARQWEDVKKAALEEQRIEQLLYIHAALDGKVDAHLVDDDEAERLTNEFKALLREVEGAEINDQLKRKLVRSLKEMIAALTLYGLWGDEALEDKATKIIGDIVAASRASANFADNGSMLKRLWHAAAKVVEVTNKASSTAKSLDDLASRGSKVADLVLKLITQN
jgi:hypothetical protein